MKAGILLCSLLLTALAVGCTSRGPIGAGDTAAAGAVEKVDWAALAGSWTGPGQYRVELVTFTDRRNGESQLVRYDIQLAPGRLVMVAQTPLGVPLYQTTVSAGAVDTIYHVRQLEGLPVEQALADFVMAHWPIDTLAAAAAEAGYTMLQNEHARQLLDSTGRLLVEIRPAPAGTGDLIEVIHHDIPLELSIRTIEGHASGLRP